VTARLEVDDRLAYRCIQVVVVTSSQIDRARDEMGLFHKRAREEMPDVPDTRASWRQLWNETSSYQYEQDFEELMSLMLQAGLADITW
jgi:hypothetical protein